MTRTPLRSSVAWLRWRFRHHVVYRCTHPEGCTRCSWCGFGIRDYGKPITALEGNVALGRINDAFLVGFTLAVVAFLVVFLSVTGNG